MCARSVLVNRRASGMTGFITRDAQQVAHSVEGQGVGKVLRKLRPPRLKQLAQLDEPAVLGDARTSQSSGKLRCIRPESVCDGSRKLQKRLLGSNPEHHRRRQVATRVERPQRLLDIPKTMSRALLNFAVTIRG